jgi:hypothetical protein
MKIWCVDHAGLSFNIYSELFFTKEEAQNRYDSLYAGPGSYRKMHQVEDIWGWCARNFDKVVDEIIASRDDGDGSTFIYGMANEIREAAIHCGVEQFNVDALWDGEGDHFILSVCWCHDGKLHHYTDWFYGIDTPYNYPSIVERRSEWQKEN